MKTILFPTDFSDCADNALIYAIGLAEKFNSKIVLHNSCHLPAFSEQVPFEGITEEQVYNDASESMKDCIARSSLEAKKINFETHITLGLAGDDIIAAAEEKNADLIVMGTKGAGGLERILLGSNATAVIEKATCPVITVPANSVYGGLNKIVFATDYNDNDIESIQFLTTLAMPYQAEILVVHVSSVTATDTLERDRFNLFKEDVKKRVHYSKVSFQLAIGLNLEKDLHTVIEEQKADMLAMSIRKRNIFSRLFSPSLTKRMNYHTLIPVLSFHAR